MKFTIPLVMLVIGLCEPAPAFAKVQAIQPAPGLEFCFSPDMPCAELLTAFIKTAKKSLDVAIYDLNEPGIVDAIYTVSATVPTRVVVDMRQSRGAHSKVADLSARGVEIRYGKQNGIMHDKFTIVDSLAVETGSFNYTNHATQANQENQAYLRNAAVAKVYHERFEKMWKDAKPVTVKHFLAEEASDEDYGSGTEER